MLYGRTVSSFRDAEDKEPWMLWEKSSKVNQLLNNDKTNCLSGEDCWNQTESRETERQLATNRLPVPFIRRSQYNAIMSRMRSAASHSGSYSSWSS